MMELSIKFQERSVQQVTGAFVAGNSSAAWLREISSWGIAPDQLRCFMMPVSIQDNTTSGVFIVLGQSFPIISSLRHPYVSLADGFFIPANAVLQPPCSNEELKGLMRYDVMVFHPSAGLVGFDIADEVNLHTLISLPVVKERGWLLALPQPAQTVPLQFVGLEPLEEEADVLENIKEDIGSSSLEDIPAPDGDRPTWERNATKGLSLLKKIGLYLLLFVSVIFQGVFGALAALLSSGTEASKYRRPGEKSLFEKMDEWLNKNLDEIRKKRDSELKRLVDMFDNDTDEALRYAIPLSSSYLDRGKAAPSWQLTRRNTGFNLGRLGGGGRADVWDIGDYNNILRERYKKAANDAVAKGNFKRAAYIYAHLLADLYQAANVLQQGGSYRDAAAIYKDHLKQTAMAAECLEKGGLFTEAIALYKELGYFEKVGDLYHALGQEEQAVKYYRQVLDQCVAAADHRNAAKLALEKLNSREEAASLYLEGWKFNKHAHECLTNYIELTAGTNDDQLQLSRIVKDVYDNHIPVDRRNSFMEVLLGFHQRHRDQLEGTTLPIAYEIAHEQANLGDTSALKLLPKFLPADRLLAADTDRYIQNRIKLPAMFHDARYIELRTDIDWIDITVFHDQIVGVGKKGPDIYLLRGDLNDTLMYENLFNATLGTRPYMICEPDILQTIFLVGRFNAITSQPEELSQFKHKFSLKAVNWLSESALSCCLSDPDTITVLSFGEMLVLSHYHLDGPLKSTYDLKINAAHFSVEPVSFDPKMMACRNGYFYFHTGNILIQIDHEGQYVSLDVGAPIIQMAIGGYVTQLKIVLLTSEGCLLVLPKEKKMTPTGGFFAEGQQVTDLRILADNRLVIAGNKIATVYNIDQHTAVNERAIHTKDDIRQIIAVPLRHHVGFLETSKQISIYNLEQMDQQ